MPSVFILAVALVTGLISAVSWSEAYPTRPIRMLIPQPPGGTGDTIIRALSNPYLVQALGQPIVFDNRSGANGIIGAQVLANAAPDGYTILYASSSLVNNQLFHKKPPFDALRDFAPVTQMTKLPGFLVYAQAQTTQSLREFVEMSKNPRTPVHYGSPGMGSNQHVIGAMLNARANAKFVHVSYKGLAPALNALLGGEVQISFGAPTTAMPHIKAGRLRAIGYTGAQRFSELPHVPTIAESVAPGFLYESSWQGVFAPAGTPAAILTRIHSELAKVAHSPKLRDLWAAGGHVVIVSTPAEFGRFLRSYLKETEEQLRIAGVEPQ